MRKFYLTLALMIGFGWAMAQNQGVVIKKESDQFTASEMMKIKKDVQKFRSDRADANKVIKSRWYGYGFELDNILGNIATATANNLWPDSTILVNYSSGYSGPWIHALGEAINPKSGVFTSPTDLNINQNMPYTIDSIGFYCIYYREAATASAVDTLMVQILENGDGNYYWEQGGNPWVLSDYGTDTLWFKGIKHDPLMYYSSDAKYTTYKFPLTAGMENDTLSNGINYFKFSLNNFGINAGQTFVATVQFVPGFTWNANYDTITSVNHMRFISNEENGDAGGAGTLPTYTKFDWNCSYILPGDWMYSPTSTVYAPAYAYVAGYGYEHHWIEFLLTADETGIADANRNNLTVGQNQPNPFSTSTTINYTLDQRADVTLTVYNVAGAKVMEMNEGSQSTGNHNIIVDGSKLKSGVYYYTLAAGANKVTKKMIVY
ncbi:MAG: T9SS type A sorting domain-containing protein [Bacteroidales bacterium]|nr:T9SS type A sorting domain-containing protein [Bacteroidales bacterium]